MAVSSLEGILKPTFPIQLQSYFSLVFQKNQVSHPVRASEFYDLEEVIHLSGL